MFINVPFALVLILVAATISTNSFATPRACIELRDEKPPTGLPDQPPVISRSRPFDHDQIAYKIQTFSETAPSGKTRAEQCFRYEVENTGAKDIRSLNWELAGIFADPLKLGFNDRRSRVRERQIIDDPIDIDSKIDTFEKTAVVTRAWADRRTKSAAVDRKDSQGLTHFSIAPEEIMSGLAQFLRQNNLQADTLVATDMSGKEEAQRARDVYSGPGFRLVTESVAIREGENVRLYTNVLLDGPRAEGTTLAMPSLRAVTSLNGSASDLREYSAFLSRFAEVSAFARNQTKWFFSANVPLKSLYKNMVYQVQNPIVVQFEDGSFDCALVTSYASLPITFSLRNCPRPKRP